MNKDYILHCKFINGKIYLDNDKANTFKYKRGLLGENSGLDTAIVTSYHIRNVLLNMIGETPIHTFKDSLLKRIIVDKKKINDDLLISDFYYEMINDILNKSYYKLKTSSYNKTFKDKKNIEHSKYLIELKRGVKKNTSERKVNDFIGNYSVQGIVTWERLKYFAQMTPELYNEIFKFLHEITNLKPLESSLKEVLLKAMEFEDKEKIKNFIVENELLKYGVYIERLFLFILDPQSLIKKRNSDGYNEIDLRFNIASAMHKHNQLYELVELKYHINVEGEFIFIVNQDFMRKLIDNYTPSSIFDGGSVFIDKMIDPNTINVREIENMGFTKFKI